MFRIQKRKCGLSLGDTSPTKLNIFPKLSVSTSAMQQKRKLTKAPLVVSKVRSERLKGKKSGDQGFLFPH
jgi:hypothetical protein